MPDGDLTARVLIAARQSNAIQRPISKNLRSAFKVQPSLDPDTSPLPHHHVLDIAVGELSGIVAPCSSLCYLIWLFYNLDCRSPSWTVSLRYLWPHRPFRVRGRVLATSLDSMRGIFP